MIITNLMDSLFSESEFFNVERSSEQCSSVRNHTLTALNSTELSGAHEKEVIIIWSMISTEPQIDHRNRFNWTDNTIWIWASGVSMTLTFHNIFLLCWLLWRWCSQTKNAVSNHWNRQTRIRYLRPRGICEYHWWLGDTTHNYGWCHILLRRRA